MKFTTKWAAALSLFALCTVSAVAQLNRTSKYAVLTTYHVKPAAVADFADFLKHKWVPAMKKGGSSPLIYSATPMGGDANVFVIASYVDSFALYDNPVTTLEKGAGAGPYARMMSQRAQMIDSRTSVVLRRMPEMSVYSEGAPTHQLLMVQYTKTAPGKQKEFNDAWKELVPAIKKSGHFVSAWRVTHGDELQFVTATPLNSFADLDQGASIAQLSLKGDAYTAWNDKVQPFIVSSHREVLRLRKDLMGE